MLQNVLSHAASATPCRSEYIAFVIMYNDPTSTGESVRVIVFMTSGGTLSNFILLLSSGLEGSALAFVFASTDRANLPKLKHVLD